MPTPTGPNNPQPPEPEQWQDFRCAEPVRSCLGTSAFLLITLIVIGDIFTDVWLTAMFGLRGHMVLAGVCLLVLVTNSLICAFMYAVLLKYEGSGGAGSGGADPPFYHVPGCLLLNVPFQLGIIGHRFKHFGHRAKHCCIITDQRNSKEWSFAKLKLAQGIFQSAIMLIINVYAVLVYWNSHHVETIQYFSAGFSFASLVGGAVNHEKVRKERVRHAIVGVAQISCITVYKTLMLGARILALVNFLYFYHELLAAILLPHFLIVFIFFAYVYRAVWKVRYYKIFLHTIYCVLAYFPIHNDYRPEGEILLYYTLFIIENIIMVSVPYALKTTQTRPKIHLPGSQYYYVITVCVLVGSAVGLCFMAIYYFLLHRSKAKIQEQHLNWLSRFCIWSNKEEDAPARPMTTQSSPDGSRFLVCEEETANMRSNMDENIEHEHLLTVTNELDESGPPPSYRSTITCHHGNHANTNSGRSSMEEGEYNKAGGVSENGSSTREGGDYGEDMQHHRGHTGRPSVLSGDDDMRDYDSDQDQDTRPLHVIV